MHTYKWLKCLVSTIVLIGMLLNFSNAGLAERRVALVIGNSAYDNAPRLNNPENDAEALSRSLATLNFTVIKKVNIDQDEFADALQEFDNALTNADIGLLFFAGHGFQMDGNNYLLSTNATLENIHSVDSEGMRLSNILTLIERKAPISISFIDACRDNPLANQLILNNAQASRSFSITRGLAALQPRFANSLVAFATAPGEVAWDGDGRNSPFTTSLLDHINENNIEISTMLKRVTMGVRTRTSNRQRPEVVSSMAVEFYFSRIETGSTNLQSQEIETEKQALEGLRAAEKSGAREAYQAIIDKYPTTTSAAVARQALKAPQAKVNRDENQSESANLLTQLATRNRDIKSSSTSSASEQFVSAERALGLEIDELKQIQIGLMDLGYEIGAVDGNLGAASRNALRTFQRRSSLQETGYLNDATIKNLYDKLTKSPQGYDGNWILDIHRYNYNKRDPGGINLRTHLASARIEVRSGDMFITSSEILTDRKGQFDTFRGEISSSGRIGISMKLDYLYGKPRTGTLKFNNILPRIVPVGQEFEYKANQIEQEIWYKIVLRRSS